MFSARFMRWYSKHGSPCIACAPLRTSASSSSNSAYKAISEPAIQELVPSALSTRKTAQQCGTALRQPTVGDFVQPSDPGRRFLDGGQLGRCRWYFRIRFHIAPRMCLPPTGPNCGRSVSNVDHVVARPTTVTTDEKCWGVLCLSRCRPNAWWHDTEGRPEIGWGKWEDRAAMSAVPY